MADEQRYLEQQIAATKELLEFQTKALDRYVDAKLQALDSALLLARRELDIRLASMNEFREALTDQAASFITRPEHAVVQDRLQSLELSRADLGGKASQKSVNIVTLCTLLSLVLSVLGILLAFLHK